MDNQLIENYKHIFEEKLLEEIDLIGNYKLFEQGEQIIDIGSSINYMPLLLEGAIKILREDDYGEELVLYFLEKGDTCALTLNCCIGNAISEIRALTETKTRVVMVPVQKMEEWMSKYKTWRYFILESYQSRMKEMLEAIDTIAFLNMDERLLKHLRDKAMVSRNEAIKTTHQDIALELHTSRVVISRLLKKLEKEKKIKLNRNLITVIDL
jgi:CRP/FNR family transcriptional regulator, anaerobic regulatory protein